MHFLSAMLLAKIYRNVDPQYLAENPREVVLSVQNKLDFETPEKAVQKKRLPVNRKGRLTFRKKR